MSIYRQVEFYHEPTSWPKGKRLRLGSETTGLKSGRRKRCKTKLLVCNLNTIEIEIR